MRNQKRKFANAGLGCLIFGMILLAGAVLFLRVAFQNPMAVSPLSYELTWAFYKLYLALMILMFFLAFLFAVISLVKEK